MSKYLLILLFLSINIFAIELNTIKVKVTQHNNVLKTKIMIQSDMVSEEVAKRKKTKPEYITNITAKIDERTVYNISTSPNVSTGLKLQFKFKNQSKTKKLEIYTTKNNSKQYKNSFQINKLLMSKRGIKSPPLQVKYLIENNFKTTHSKVWEETDPRKAIEKLYGSQEMIENIIHVKVPIETQNKYLIPVSIKSDLNLESIAILTDNNPKSLIAIISIPKNGMIDYALNIKAMGVYYYNEKYYNQPSYEANIIVIGKAYDGKLYRTIKRVKLLGAIPTS